MGSAASSKNKPCKSLLPDEGPVLPLRQTLRDRYLDNFDSKALPLLPEEHERKSMKIQKRSRCELHPFELPYDSEYSDESDDEGMMDHCKVPALSESAAAANVSLREGSEMIQKRKRCSMVPDSLLQQIGSDSDASDSEDELDGLLGDLEIFEREMPRDTIPAQRGVASIGCGIVLHRF